MVWIQVEGEAKQIAVMCAQESHVWQGTVSEYFCSHSTRPLLVWSMGIHVPGTVS